MRCMKAKMWNDSPLLLKQLDGIGEQYAKKLLDAGVTNFEQLKECEPWKIETACNRYPPFGHNVHETVSILPSLKLDIERVIIFHKGSEIYYVTSVYYKSIPLPHKINMIGQFNEYLIT